MAGLRVGEQRGAGEETLERVDLLEDLDITMVTRFESSERLATVEDMSRPLRNDRSANRMREGDTLTSRKTVFILSPNAFHRLSSSNVQWNSFDFSSSVQCFAPPPWPQLTLVLHRLRIALKWHLPYARALLPLLCWGSFIVGASGSWLALGSN